MKMQKKLPKSELEKEYNFGSHSKIKSDLIKTFNPKRDFSSKAIRNKIFTAAGFISLRSSQNNNLYYIQLE